jgi:hypothetical protein
MENAGCQIQSVPKMCQSLGSLDAAWQRRNRLKRIFKRRWTFFANLLTRSKPEVGSDAMAAADHTAAKSQPLQAGDRVRVKSWGEIKATLNNWNQLKGCSFMEEMLPYCGTTQRVLKPVRKFLDERDYLVKKSKGILILDGVFCEGTIDFGSCDRTCFFFWREEWLENIN